MWLRKTESLEEKTEEMTEGIWERGVRSFWRWWGISVFTNVFPARASSNLCCLLFVTYLWVQSMWSEPLWCEFESVLPPVCDLFMSAEYVKRAVVVRVRVCVASSLWLIYEYRVCEARGASSSLCCLLFVARHIKTTEVVKRDVLVCPFVAKSIEIHDCASVGVAAKSHCWNKLAPV